MRLAQVDPNAVAQIASPAGIAAAILSAFGYLAPIVGVCGGTVAIVYYVLIIVTLPDVKQWRRHRKLRRLSIRKARLITDMAELGLLTKADLSVTETEIIRTDESHWPKDGQFTSKPSGTSSHN